MSMTPVQIATRQRERQRHPQVCSVCGQDFWDTYCGLTTCCFAEPIDAPAPQAVVLELPALPALKMREITR